MKRSRPSSSPPLAASSEVGASKVGISVEVGATTSRDGGVERTSDSVAGGVAASGAVGNGFHRSTRTPSTSRIASASAIPATLPMTRALSFDTPESESLFERWRDHGDERARERLILLHRSLVMYLARRLAPGGDAFEDVVQVGTLGLIHALDAFDPKRGLRFSTFATPTIAGEIRRYFRDKVSAIRVPRRLQEQQKLISQRIETLTQQLDRSPTYAEIGRAMGLEAEEVAEIMELGHTINVASLDEPNDFDAPNEGSRAEELGAPDPDLERWGEYTALETALELLTPRSREILQMAYFQGFSQAEIARRLNVSQMQISRVQRRALAELKKLLDEA